MNWSESENFRRAILLKNGQTRREAARFECLGGEHTRDFRMIILLADVSEHQMGYARRKVLFNVFRHDKIREMADTAHDTLLDRPRIWTDLQHV